MDLTHLTSSVSSTLGSMIAGGRTSACRMTCRSASARPLDTEFTLTHFSVRPKSSSANIRGMVSLASVCKTQGTQEQNLAKKKKEKKRNSIKGFLHLQLCSTSYNNVQKQPLFKGLFFLGMIYSKMSHPKLRHDHEASLIPVSCYTDLVTSQRADVLCSRTHFPKRGASKRSEGRTF